MIYKVFESCGVREYREVYRTESKEDAIAYANNGEVVTEGRGGFDDDTIIYPKNAI